LSSHAAELCELPNIRGSKFDGKFTILNQNQQLAILEDCLMDCHLVDDFDLSPRLLNALSRSKLASSTGQQQEQNERKQGDDMSRLLQAYCSKLCQYNCVDFDYLILYTRDLLHHNEEV
jgi:superfamily I DNA/RNA helicase